MSLELELDAKNLAMTVDVTNLYFLPFLYLILLNLILSHHVINPMIGHVTHMTSIMHFFIFFTCVLHVFPLFHIQYFFIYD